MSGFADEQLFDSIRLYLQQTEGSYALEITRYQSDHCPAPHDSNIPVPPPQSIWRIQEENPSEDAISR
jgi:hypothetical protein